MVPDYLWWGPMCGLPFILSIIMLAVLFMALCFFFGRRGFCSPWYVPTRPEDQSLESALETLKKRYAKCEIIKEEFEKMQMDIRS
jgi:uncharacterized membrane protein